MLKKNPFKTACFRGRVVQGPLNPYLAVVLVQGILVVGQVDDTLDELQHQGGHHLDEQRLSVLVRAVQSGE